MRQYFIWVCFFFTAIVASVGTCNADTTLAGKVPPILKSQVLLRNAFALKNGEDYEGSSAFLLTSGGKLFAITARAVLNSGDIKPEVLPSQLNESLKLWAFYVPGTSNFDLHADRLITVSDNQDSQYLVLSISNPNASAGITPLALAADLPKRGDIVYMPGCPLSDRTCHQNVYKFKIIDYRGRAMLAEPLEPATDMGSYSGAPIIDKDGDVLAIGVGAIMTGKLKGDVALFSLQGLDIGK